GLPKRSSTKKGISFRATRPTRSAPTPSPSSPTRLTKECSPFSSRARSAPATHAVVRRDAADAQRPSHRSDAGGGIRQRRKRRVEGNRHAGWLRCIQLPARGGVGFGVHSRRRADGGDG